MAGGKIYGGAGRNGVLHHAEGDSIDDAVANPECNRQTALAP